MTDENRPGDEERGDDELAPEVRTTFATKGVGWSGREEDDLQVIESDTDAKPHSFRRSRPADGQ